MSFPVRLEKNQPADSDNPSAGAAQIRNLKGFLEDLFGVLDTQTYTAKAMDVALSGQVTIAQQRMLLQDGSATIPAFAFSGATGTGFSYDTAKSAIAVLRGGSRVSYLGLNDGEIQVDALGADPTGVSDSSAAVQAAIDANYRRVVFNPSGVYLFNTAVTIPSLPDANNLILGREIDGQGCRIIGANGIANCFVMTGTDIWPNCHSNGKFHHFVFGGTVTGAFVLHTADASWYNEYYHLNVTGGDTGAASGTALLEIRNTSLRGNPGAFTIHHLNGGGLKDTLLFSMVPGAYGVFDNFDISNIYGGAYIEHASAIRISPGCQLRYCHIRDIISGGPHAINGDGGGGLYCIVERILIEAPTHTVAHPTAFANNWGVSGTWEYCRFDDIRGAFNNLIDNPGFRMVYGTINNSQITNVGMAVTSCYEAGVNDAARPYADSVDYATLTNPVVTQYPAIELDAAINVTFNFPPECVERGLQVNAGPAHNAITYLGGVLHHTVITGSDIPFWVCRGGIVDNAGQSAECWPSLPQAFEGLDLRVSLLPSAFPYNVGTGSATDKIVLDGVVLDDQHRIRCVSPTFGTVVHLYTVRSGGTSPATWTYDWIATTEGGTWVDGGY